MSEALHRTMRVRRPQPTRLESFVDSSFAFAVTLIVISIGHVPATVAEMLIALRGLPTFAVCFLLITRIWLAHRDWSRWYDIEDATTVSLSLLLVFVVLIYVYPLRLLFAQMFIGLSNRWLSDGSMQPLGGLDELRIAYIVFGLGLGAISLLLALLYNHALYQATQIGLSAPERIYTQSKMRMWCLQVALSLLSIALACWMPMPTALMSSVPGLIYALNIGLGRFERARCRRQMRSVDASP